MSETERDRHVEEQPLDPGRVIVDPHHHLWDHGEPFLLPEMLKTLDEAGHKVVQTVYVECRAMYRQDGPEELKPVGETEFANGIAAMSASGRYGDCRIAAGIVGTADLRLGARVKPVLEAQIAAGNGRLRGIRTFTAYVQPEVFGGLSYEMTQGIMMEPGFHDGVRALPRFGLTLDVWCFHPQLGEVIDLASACPDTTIILDHVGTPLHVGPYANREAEVLADWRKSITELARRPNVRIKLGGLGMDLGAAMGSVRHNRSSSRLAAEWGPYIETCITAFGPNRCMFESNFPPDNATCSYGALWNAFKIIAAAYSEDEKAALFSGTARQVYRLG